MNFSNERVQDYSAMSYDIIISGMSIYNVNIHYSNRLKHRDMQLYLPWHDQDEQEHCSTI